MITWTKESKLLNERLQPFNYKESKTVSIRKNATKTIIFFINLEEFNEKPRI